MGDSTVVPGKVSVFQGFEIGRLCNIIKGISKVRIGFIGDICLDVYWKADMTRSEISRETPHFPLPVIEERMSPGAGANAAANAAELKPESIDFLGIIGKDWRGSAVVEELKKRGVKTNGIICSEKRITNAYCKPVRQGISQVEYEDPRIDFENYELVDREDENKLIDSLAAHVGNLDVLCVCDQFRYGCITDRVREEIIKLAKEGLRIVIDSRDRIELYTDVVLKPNEVEGCRAVYKDWDPKKVNFEQQLEAAKLLSKKNRSGVCMTLGSKGCVYTEGTNVIHIPSHEIPPPVDICGAGDTFIAAFSCALVSGAEPPEAAFFANLAAQVTVAKIGTTGTANPEEIKKRYLCL